MENQQSVPGGVEGGVVSRIGMVKKYVRGPSAVFVGWVLFCGVLLGFIFLFPSENNPTTTNGDTKQNGLTLSGSNGEACNVVGISLHGGIRTYLPEWWQNDQSLRADEKNVIASDRVTNLLDLADKDSRVKAVILEVDSLGGSPVAAEEIAGAIEHSSKPVVGYVRQSAVSAAYWAVSKTYPIFASKNSDIGGIGVTASYLENINKDKRFVQISTGKFKDSGNPDKPLTEEERILFLRDVKIIHEDFIETIAKNRNIPVEKVRALADGATVLGVSAKRLGLIDEIGSLYDVKAYLEKTINTKPSICWY